MSELTQAILHACIWEARARKAGNVHPGAMCGELSFTHFQRSAEAIAPVIEHHWASPIGLTVLEAVRATRRVVSTNSNLGIVLLLVPLSKVNPPITRAKLETILDTTRIEDSEHVYEAIRLAKPGGLGQVKDQDVANKPTVKLREVMTLAADRDLIARQYAGAFREVLGKGVPALIEGLRDLGNVEGAILHTQIQMLSQFPDSLILRKHGNSIADEVTRRANEIDLTTREGIGRYVRFDRFLRAYRLNPGTTADLIAACLFVALRERRLSMEMPFDWRESFVTP